MGLIKHEAQPLLWKKVRAMATVRNVKLTAAKTAGAGNNWVITVTYRAGFSQQEWSTSNYNFRDSFQLWEEDNGEWGDFTDDAITGNVAASTFNPNAATVNRTLTFNFSADTLNNDLLGDERLYAVVRLRNMDLNITYTGKSQILILAV